MDISIGELIIIAVIFWILSQIVLGVIDGLQIVTLSEKIKQLNHISNLIHQVKVEKHSGMEYWFDEDDNKFLGQGKTMEDTIDHIKSRFPDHIFLIQGKGGVSKQTDWKLLDTEEFKKVKLNLDEL
jgi:hypothetical protein